mgnify:CR=1 FL=1
MIVFTLMFIGISISLFQAYISYVRDKEVANIKPYLWYKGPVMMVWQMNQDQKSRSNNNNWRLVSNNMINRSNKMNCDAYVGKRNMIQYDLGQYKKSRQ